MKSDIVGVRERKASFWEGRERRRMIGRNNRQLVDGNRQLTFE